MTREEAIEELKKLPYDEQTIAQDIEFVANKLAFTVPELESYLDAPKRSYHDYKSQKWVYDLGAKVMKLLRMEVGGKR
jgi:predicted lipoprotein